METICKLCIICPGDEKFRDIYIYIYIILVMLNCCQVIVSLCCFASIYFNDRFSLFCCLFCLAMWCGFMWLDLIEQPGEKMLTESLYPSIMQMVSANVCRALPPPTDDFDPEEDEPVLESSWPHLQVRCVYRIVIFHPLQGVHAVPARG